MGVPVEVAKLLTYPEKVTRHNIELLRYLVRNGPDVYPGAVRIVLKFPMNIKKNLKYGNRDLTANGLKPGDIVERYC